MIDKPLSDVSYEQFLREDKLMGSRCKKCGDVFTPPRPICPKCTDSELEWVQMKGTGKLAAFTCISIGPGFMNAEGYSRKNPYCVGVVELDEGTRVDARIEGVDTLNPETIKVGTPMTVKFLHRGEGIDQKVFLAFEPV